MFLSLSLHYCLPGRLAAKIEACLVLISISNHRAMRLRGFLYNGGETGQIFLPQNPEENDCASFLSNYCLYYYEV